MRKFLTCTALSVILLSGCSFQQKNNGIVKVNNSVITKSEFDKRLDLEINNSVFKNFGGADNFVKEEKNVMYRIFRDKVIHELIVKSLIDEEINKRGIKVTKEDIDAEMKATVEKVGSMENLNNTLKERGISNAAFMEDLKTQIRIKKLIDTIDKINVSDAEVEKYYKSNLDKFKYDEQVRASHILISADTLQIIREIKAKNKKISPDELNQKLEKVMAEKKALAEEVFAEVKANPDRFELIASQKSEDRVSGERGGELGYFPKEAMVPEFSKVAFEMKPNTISDSLVKSPYGYHIIKVTDRIEPGTTPLVKAKEQIRFYLKTQKQIEILKNLTDGLLKTAKIEYLDKSYKPASNIKEQVKNDNKKINK